MNMQRMRGHVEMFPRLESICDFLVVPSFAGPRVRGQLEPSCQFQSAHSIYLSFIDSIVMSFRKFNLSPITSNTSLHPGVLPIEQKWALTLFRASSRVHTCFGIMIITLCV